MSLFEDEDDNCLKDEASDRRMSRTSASGDTRQPGVKKTRARAPETDAAWSLEPHVCRHCFGRLVSRATPPGPRLYQCTNCGAEAIGSDSRALCSCGLELRRPGAASVSAGLRCQPNPSPTPEFPSLFVAAEART